MGFGLVFALFVVGLVLFAVAVAVIGPRMAGGARTQQEQENIGVGADQKK